ncbi:thiol methyltransferase [Cladorrhinum sp. PSN259]|nr:thiol methyltransferase [Cladorrhinum sp. PSN259]
MTQDTTAPIIPTPTIIQGHHDNYDLPAQPNRLASTFANHHDLPSYHKQWDIIWKEHYTPWDRGAPSPALSGLLTSPPSPFRAATLFPKHSSTTGNNPPKALVPGCGRGYDPLLLSSFGYDVVGLDLSPTSLSKAKELESFVSSSSSSTSSSSSSAAAAAEIYAVKPGVEKKGKITWVQGDFFKDEFLRSAGTGKFDVIFDYTFFVALPPTARPAWAKRMKELLDPETGRLVCLEWPLRRDIKAGGPPWGVTKESYEEVLGGDGNGQGLKRLCRYQPEQTHPAGYDEEGRVIDFVSVWGY